jgi:thymidylate synthase
MQILRSNDLHRGLPYNFLQFTVLQEIMAGWLGLGVGRYHQWSDSLHVYVDAASQFSCAPETRLAMNTDSLAIDVNRGEALVGELYQRMVDLAKPEVSESQLAELALIRGAPEGYQNLLRVLGAESARRRARHDQATEVMAGCTNPQLIQAWSAWSVRTQRMGSGSRTETSPNGQSRGG